MHGLMLASLMLLAACAPLASRNAETGDHLFARYCAACHGEDARGDGVANAYLIMRAPDLTLIAARRNGKFDPAEIYAIIDGQAGDDYYTHRYMPVWGYEFYGGESDDQKAHQRAADRVKSLVAYLQRIQRTDSQ
jgi:mono/diheme cytochrome c family protein